MSSSYVNFGVTDGKLKAAEDSTRAWTKHYDGNFQSLGQSRALPNH